MGLTRQVFGATASGAAVDLFTLTNARGIEARIMTYGATIVSLKTPDRSGRLGDVLLGFDTIEGFLGPHPFFGVVAGRYANRIARGRFELDGVSYELAVNNGLNHLHGGLVGFDKVIWQARVAASGAEPSVELSYRSADGEEGYPGALDARVTYTLTAQDELRIDYQATTDRATVLNLTNHAYFNLAGQGDILAHQLQVFGARFLPTDATQIPTGEIRPVAGTPWDFGALTPVGARTGADDEQLRFANGGYDHTWAVDGEPGAYRIAVRVYEPESGRVMEVFTTQPGAHIYIGNMLDGTLAGKGGQVYHKYAGLCVETQHYPDSPNQPGFPSTVLRPGEVYRESTGFRFSAR